MLSSYLQPKFGCLVSTKPLHSMIHYNLVLCVSQLCLIGSLSSNYHFSTRRNISPFTLIEFDYAMRFTVNIYWILHHLRFTTLTPYALLLYIGPTPVFTLPY